MRVFLLAVAAVPGLSGCGEYITRAELGGPHELALLTVYDGGVLAAEVPDAGFIAFHVDEVRYAWAALYDPAADAVYYPLDPPILTSYAASRDLDDPQPVNLFYANFELPFVPERREVDGEEVAVLVATGLAWPGGHLLDIEVTLARP